jgi:hypothetical protein
LSRKKPEEMNKNRAFFRIVKTDSRSEGRMFNEKNDFNPRKRGGRKENCRREVILRNATELSS